MLALSAVERGPDFNSSPSIGRVAQLYAVTVFEHSTLFRFLTSTALRPWAS